MSAPTPLGDLFAAAMSRADGCEGCDNTEPPRAAVPIDGGWMTSYLCSTCGRAWTTDYPEETP